MTPIDARLESHPSVSRIMQLGYCITYEFRPGGRYLNLVVDHQGLRAGHLMMELRPRTGEMAAERFSVYEGHRRKGVGTALYVCARLLTGLTIVPAANQTDDGRAFWSQPNPPWR